MLIPPDSCSATMLVFTLGIRLSTEPRKSAQGTPLDSPQGVLAPPATGIHTSIRALTIGNLLPLQPMCSFPKHDGTIEIP